MKVGILSLAHMHAYGYAKSIESIPGLILDSVWDDDPNRGARASSAFGVPYVADMAEFLGRGLDIVIVCSENASHRAHVEAACRMGINVLCEKPIATRSEDAVAMIRAASDAGVRLSIAYSCRYAGPVQAAYNRLVREGALGAVHAIVATNRGKMPGGWFVNPEASGGGAVIDHTVHVVDLVRWFKSAEVERVWALADRMIHKDIPVEDCGLLCMELTDGTTVTLDTSWSRPKVYPTWGDVTMQFIGDRGVLAVDAFGEAMTVYDDRNGRMYQAGWGINSDAELLRSFASAVGGDTEPLITGVDGLRCLEVVEAAYESIATNRLVAVKRAEVTSS